MSRDLPDRRCPSCGYLTQMTSCMTTDAEDKPPRPGDLTVCFKCTSLLVFTKNLQMRFPTLKEYAMIENDPEARNQIAKIRAGLRMLKSMEN